MRGKKLLFGTAFDGYDVHHHHDLAGFGGIDLGDDFDLLIEVWRCLGAD